MSRGAPEETYDPHPPNGSPHPRHRGRLRNTVKRNGRTLKTNFALHATVKDQRITRYHLYEDSYAVAQAYFGEPSE
jgi:ketosteroid isomerase-like protein